MPINAGDTAWLLASAALVMFMTPGLAFFYGGLVRAKNVLGTVMQSFVALGLVSVLWALIGYTLAFGPDKGGLIGGLDFAGGSVVHANAGAAALATALYLGKRRGYGSTALAPHNVPLVMLGAGILWFGWFGFNAGSAFSAGGLASSAFVNTQLGAAAAMLAWMIAERLRVGRATTVGAATGAVAGLATITPASGYVQPWGALLIGAAAGFVCFAAVLGRTRLDYDDSLDVVGVHMVGGMLGVVLTGAFASLAINAAGAAASGAQVGRQLVLALVTVAYSFVMTMILLKVTDAVVGLRASGASEDEGLDLSQHGEVAYRWSETQEALAEPSPRGAGLDEDTP